MQAKNYHTVLLPSRVTDVTHVTPVKAVSRESIGPGPLSTESSKKPRIAALHPNAAALPRQRSGLLQAFAGWQKMSECHRQEGDTMSPPSDYT
jgi:hypothetical protein